MKTIEKADATDSLATSVDQAQDTPLVITDMGQPVAVLLPLPNADMETVSLSTNPKFVDLIERSRVRQAAQGGISGQEMRRRLNLG